MADRTDQLDVNQLVTVTFVYDAALGSPADTQVLGGRVVAVPPAYIPLPVRGRFLGQPGYSRQAGGAWEWVLQGDVDPVDAFVDSLTGRGSWLVPQSRAVIKLLIQRLFSAGIPRSTIATQVPQMYAAVAAEIRAEDAAPPP